MFVTQHTRFTARTNSIGYSARPKPQSGCDLRMPVELHFDSFSTPTSGARSAVAPTPRQLLYRAEPYQLDLLIEAHAESNHLTVTGQLLDTSHPAIFRRGARVTLWNGRQSLVSLTTSEWGEFLGEIENSGELIVSLKIQMREIVIAIRNVLGQTPLDS